jgi:hypothetical protein
VPPRASVRPCTRSARTTGACPRPAPTGTCELSSSTWSASTGGWSRCWQGGRSRTSATSCRATCVGATTIAAHDDAAAQATTAVADADLSAITHLSFGDVPAEYIRQLLADLLIHGWDLSRALGLDERLDAEVVSEVAGWFTEREDLPGRPGAVGPRPSGTPPDGQDSLLVAFGAQPSTDDTLSVLRQFNEAFGRRDVER